MSGEFIGTIPDNAVHKARIMIPVSFRKKISQDANNSVIVTLGPKGTIAIYPIDSWQMTRKQLQNRTDDKSKKLLKNLFNFAMTEQVLEGPGRIRLSEELMKHAKIKDSVSIKGEGHYMTVWNSEILKDLKQIQAEEHIEEYDETDYQINDLS